MSNGWLTIRNWDKWQTYRKDRQQPPWIKLHRDLLRNADWVSLSDAQRGQMACIWMLAADRNGRIPDDPKVVQRLCFMDKPPDLNNLMAHGFLDARVTPPRRQGDATVTPQNRVEENRGEESGADAPTPKRKSQVPEDWQPKPETILSLKTNEGFQEGVIRGEVPKFRDYHRSKGSEFRDFEAAFRNWMRKSREFIGTNGGATNYKSNGQKGNYVSPYKPFEIGLVEEPEPTPEEKAERARKTAEITAQLRRTTAKLRV